MGLVLLETGDVIQLGATLFLLKNKLYCYVSTIKSRNYKCFFSHEDLTTLFYKITNIERALWLAERRVCIIVCKHSCDLEMLCFSRANHASTNLKKVFELKTRQVMDIIHGQVYFIYPFPCRLKLGKSLQTCCVILFPLSWHFNREKSVFWKTPFRITRTDYACKTW